MKKGVIVLIGCFILILAACTEKQQSKNPDGDDRNNGDVAQQNEIEYELLMHLQFLPHEVGTTMTLIQEEKLYNSWAEIFQFESKPEINFEQEEVLFITYYSNGCGVEFESLQQEKDTLIAKLDYPKEIRNQKEINCTEIGLPHTFVLKLAKTGATTGTLIAMNRTLLEQEQLHLY